jgi:hypothetical protein
MMFSFVQSGFFCGEGNEMQQQVFTGGTTIRREEFGSHDNIGQGGGFGRAGSGSQEFFEEFGSCPGIVGC